MNSAWLRNRHASQKEENPDAYSTFWLQGAADGGDAILAIAINKLAHSQPVVSIEK